MQLKDLMYKNRLVTISLFLLISIPNFNFGQASVLKGVVTDQEGKPLKNATIIFLDPSRGTKFTTKCNEEGQFMKVGIPPSSYIIKVEYEGYFPFKTRFRVKLGMKETLQIKLKKIPPKIDEDENLAEGVNLFSQGQYQEAIKAFEKITYKFPNNFMAFYNLGLSYLRNGNIDEAILNLDKAVKLKPDLVEAYFALGESYFNKGNSEKAMEAFSKARELQPDNAKAHYNLGINYYKCDQPEEAISSFEKCIELDPHYSSAYYQLALAHIKKGNFKKAIIYLEEFLKLNPEEPKANQVQAMIDALKKQIDKF